MADSVNKYTEYTVYIDESGDLGYQKGTRWFVLSAVIVKKEDEPDIRKEIIRIRSNLNFHVIHINKIYDFYRRAVVVRDLKNCKFTYMNVLVDTYKMEREKLGSSEVAYNYCCKILLQRVSWFLRDNNGCGSVVLSARGTRRDGELIKYITEKLFPYEGNQIDQNVFRKVSAKSASEWDLLQLADVCATTMFLAYETNKYGFTTPCFSLALVDHLYKYSGKYDGYGIKYFAAEMAPEKDELKKAKPCFL